MLHQSHTIRIFQRERYEQKWTFYKILPVRLLLFISGLGTCPSSSVRHLIFSGRTKFIVSPSCYLSVIPHVGKFDRSPSGNLSIKENKHVIVQEMKNRM